MKYLYWGGPFIVFSWFPLKTPTKRQFPPNLICVTRLQGKSYVGFNGKPKGHHNQNGGVQLKKKDQATPMASLGRPGMELVKKPSSPKESRAKRPVCSCFPGECHSATFCLLLHAPQTFGAPSPSSLRRPKSVVVLPGTSARKRKRQSSAIGTAHCHSARTSGRSRCRS